MHDLRLYVRDQLTEYAKLQRFEVKPSYHARCMDWERMLAEFEWPHYSKVGFRNEHYLIQVSACDTFSCRATLRQHCSSQRCALPL
jgi:hypothetical protein